MPRSVPSCASRPASSIAVGLVALAGILTLLLAAPAVLLAAWHTLGPPLPSPHELTGPDDGTVFVRILCLIGWAAWASFTWATVAEVLAQWRGWRLPAIGWQQRLAADLIAAVAVLFASPTITSTAAAPLAIPAATAAHTPADSKLALAAASTGKQPARAAYIEHRVQAGEQMPALAERYLGDKYRWHAIAAATYGLPQPDGRTLRRGDTRVYPGWTVRIPTTNTLSTATPSTALTPNTVLAANAAQAIGTPKTTGTPVADSHPTAAATTTPASEATTSTDESTHTAIEYQAREGDWVWYIAERFLADPDRYPDIAALNPHLARKYGTAFPDHIEPGDTLRLPADAHDHGPRAHATGTVTTTPPPAADPDTPTTPPTTSPTNPPTTVPTTPATAVDTTTTPTTSTATPTADPAAQPAGPHRGIDIGDQGWVTTDLAAAIAALAALIWIQRRRRYRPRPLNPAPRAEADLTPLPAAVTTLHAAHPTATTDDQTAAEDRTTIEDDMDDPEPHARLAATVTHATLGTNATGATLRLSDLPALGIGWTGPGAPNAARALIVSILSAGGPWAPTAEATLITTRPTLTNLLPDTDARAADPLRLHLADTTEQALTELEHQLLRRAREAADPDTSTSTPLDDDPEAEQLVPAPLILLADAPTAGTATRLAAIVTVGARLGITAVLLGDWPPGGTWHLAPDGSVTDADGGQAAGAERRVNTLDPTAATEILHALREAHPTDDPDHLPASVPPPPPPPAPALPQESPAATPTDQVARLPGHGLLPAHRPPEPTTPPGQHTNAGPGPHLQLQVLGPPLVRVSDEDGRVSDLRIRRRDGLQLLVYFTVEPAGATSDQLMALLWPDSRPRHSRGRFHTTLSELRHTLIDALGGDPIHRTEDRYHLDPTRTDADLWDLATAIDHAATAIDHAHHAALHDVVHRYTGPVAEGHTWLWLDPYRETVRRNVLDAYTALAEAEPDPHAALTIIQDAIRVDPYNENLYQRAMHLHAHLGSPDGIHRALRTITKRLNELEIPLSPRTQQTASHLLERLATRERLRHPTT